MKIRSDFVSNSSSTSFVITSDVQNAITVFLKNFANTDINWLISDDIYISLECKERNASNLELLFNDNEYKYQKYKDWDIEHKYEISPEDTHYISDITLSKFINVLTEYPQNKLCDILDKIESIHFISIDSRYIGIVFLTYLFKYFQKHNFKPDDTNSERNLLSGSSDMLIKLIESANNNETTI